MKDGEQKTIERVAAYFRGFAAASSLSDAQLAGLYWAMAMDRTEAAIGRPVTRQEWIAGAAEIWEARDYLQKLMPGAELATSAEHACDRVPPPGAPAGVACPLRRGHAGACRYFGPVTRGGY